MKAGFEPLWKHVFGDVVRPRFL